MGTWYDEDGNTVRLPQSQMSWMRENFHRYRHPAEQLLAEAVAFTHDREYPRMGVYLLISAGRVVYVGQSKQIYYRLNQHVAAGKEFDSVAIVRTPSLILEDVEAYYYRMFRPCLNRMEPRGFLREEEQNAPVA